MKGRKPEQGRAGNKNTEREENRRERGCQYTETGTERDRAKKKTKPKCIWGVAVSSVYASRWWTARWAGQWRDRLWRSGM